ncbi:MAG TPA: hypothetical protein VI729_02610 [Anaerolineales bacterium]|nr:hypothetical protein [Anaerolineales bacterium]
MSGLRVAERLLAIFGISILAIFAVGILFPQPASAWDCGKYNFRVTASGQVQAENRSSSNENAQKADVFVNGSKVLNDAQVPSMPKETDWTGFAEIVPPADDWTWRVKGESDCEDEGEHHGAVSTATPAPTAPPTSVPTATPELSASPTATAVPPATSTPQPTASPTQDSQPTQTATLTQVPPSEPTDTPKPAPTQTSPPATSRPIATATDRPLGTPFGLAVATATPTTTGSVCMACCCACGCGYVQTPIIVNVNVEVLSADNPAVLRQLSAPAVEPDLRKLELEVFAVFFVSGANLILLVYLILSRKSSSNA